MGFIYLRKEITIEIFGFHINFIGPHFGIDFPQSQRGECKGFLAGYLDK